MKQPNDDRYKDLMKSVAPDFDAQQQWEQIELALEERETRRRGAFWWWWAGAGAFAVVLLGIIWVGINNSSVEAVKMAKEEGLEQISTTDEREIEGSASLPPIVNNDQSSDLSIAPEKSPIIFSNTAISAKTQEEEGQKKQLNTFAILQPLPPRNIKLSISVDLPTFTPAMATLPTLIPSLSSPSNFPNIDLIPTPVEDNQVKHSLRFEGSWGNSFRTLSTDQANLENLVNLQANAIQSRHQTRVAMSYGYYIRPKLEAFVGLEYWRLTEQLNTTTVNITQTFVESDSAFFYRHTADSIEYFPGQLAEDVLTTRRVRQYNHLHALGVTLGLSYHPRLFNHPFFVSAAYTFHPWTHITGKTIDETSEIIDYETTNQNDFIRSQLSLLHIQLGTGFALPGGKWQIRTGLNYTGTLSNITAQNGIKNRYGSVGLNVGLVRTW